MLFLQTVIISTVIDAVLDKLMFVLSQGEIHFQFDWHMQIEKSLVSICVLVQWCNFKCNFSKPLCWQWNGFKVQHNLRFHVVRVASLLSKILPFIFDGVIMSEFLAIGRSTFATWFWGNSGDLATNIQTHL